MTDDTDNTTELVPVTSVPETPPKKRGNPLWQKGVSGNPKGKPKGARTRLGEAFMKAMAADFKEHKIDVIKRCREEKPVEYLKIVAELLPRGFELDVKATADDTFLELLRQMNTTAKIIQGEVINTD